MQLHGWPRHILTHLLRVSLAGISVTLLLIVSGLLPIARLLAVSGLAVTLLLAVGLTVAPLRRAAAVVILVGHVLFEALGVLQ